jgi:hypothetical protein
MRWVVISVIVGGLTAVGLLVRARLGGINRPDVGSVSGQWIAEHHADRG